eukprot:11878558-Alexandrium_andersonii.AAC.1
MPPPQGAHPRWTWQKWGHSIDGPQRALNTGKATEKFSFDFAGCVWGLTSGPNGRSHAPATPRT